MTIPLLLEFRGGLLNHTAVSRDVGMLESRLKCTLNAITMSHAYLAFEASTDHDYEFSCHRCGYYPKGLVYDVTKKAVFR